MARSPAPFTHPHVQHLRSAATQVRYPSSSINSKNSHRLTSKVTTNTTAPCRLRASAAARAFAAAAPAATSTSDGAGDEGTAPTFPEPTAAYLHLPFCKKKCLYCDFPVIAVGLRPDAEKVQDNMRSYVDAVLREAAATRRLNGSAPLATVFFGGGTPSLIPPALLEEMLTALDRRFGIALGAEISIEADPGTFDAALLRSYRSLGVSRVSVGVQAFNDELLKTCGRAHDLSDVYKAIEAVYAADVPSWSLDLMSGLPGLTQDAWEHSLEAAIDASPSHVSVYDLQIEEHTPFAKQYRPGVAPLPSDEAAAAMYCTASTVLRAAGYEHYEVSNYAKPGHRCAHNMTYWEGKPYYAFGMGAASYLEGRRFSRPRRLAAYLKWLEDMETWAAAAPEGNKEHGIVPGSEVAQETPADVLTDTIMLRLRLSDGLDLRQLAASFVDGPDAVGFIIEALKVHEDAGRVVFEWDDQDREVVKVRLTDPAGFVMSNDVISDVFAALDEMEK